MIKKDIIKLGNKVIKKIENVPSLHCEVCGSPDIDHGAIWEDSEGSNRLVCEDCHRWLRGIYPTTITPSSGVFFNSIEDY